MINNKIHPLDRISSILYGKPPVAAETNPEFIADLKVLRIAKILKHYPDLKKHEYMMNHVLSLARGSQSPDIKRQWMEWIKQSSYSVDKGIIRLDYASYTSDSDKAALVESCPNDLGRFEVHTAILTFSDQALASVKESDFWDFLVSELVETVVIQEKDGQSIKYEGLILTQLIEKRPALPCLLEKITLLFKDGQIAVPKQKLVLCGDYFNIMFDGRFQATDRIDLSKGYLTLNAFKDVLSVLETGSKTAETIDEEYENAVAYFQFQPPVPKLPEGCLGYELFQERGGRLTDFTPVQWRKWALAIEGMKKDIRGEVIFGIDPGLSINEINSKGAVKFFYDPIESKFLSSQSKPCLFVRSKSVLKNSLGVNYHSQMGGLISLSKKSPLVYEPLTIREAVVFETLHFLKTGQYLLSPYYTNTSDEFHTPWSFESQYMRISFGVNSSGIPYIRYEYLTDMYTGIALSIKFYQ